jgi:hypothetical protein
MARTLRTRWIHLDFHTGPWIDDVGRDFNARRFAETFRDARVDSVTVFAKCHHGHLYFKTKHPARHPGLPANLDLLGEQVKALHAADIRAPIYISVQCDEYAANTHPEWIALEGDGKRVGAPPFAPGWQILDMSSPYQDYLYEQTEEVLRRFKPVDGIFFDMCWDQPSASKWAKAGMIAEGLDPEKEEDRKRYSNIVAMRYMKRFYALVKKYSPAGLVFFNGRGHTHFDVEKPFFTHDEIESLPTGGWGYTFFPRNVRYVRHLGLPYLSHTARFHKSWADFGGIKPEAALRYETSLMLAHGSGCAVGDQLHPRGTLDGPSYELIGKAYSHVEACEPWCVGATAETDVAVLRLVKDSYGEGSDAETGALKMLTQLKTQFDIIAASDNFNRYRLLILPDGVRVDAALDRKIAAFLKGGGRLLASGSSGLDEKGKVVLKALPIVSFGPSPFSATYFRAARETAADVPATDNVMYEPSIRVKPARGAKVLARIVEPYFERSWRHFCSHRQTPPDRVSPYAAAVEKGPVAYIAYPIFTAYEKHGNLPYKYLVRNIIDRLLADPAVRAKGPSSLEVSLMKQPGRLVVHLLNFVAERRTPDLDIIEDIFTVDGIELSVAVKGRVKSVYIAPDRRKLEYELRDGRVNLRVDGLHGHAMVVIEG